MVRESKNSEKPPRSWIFISLLTKVFQEYTRNFRKVKHRLNIEKCSWQWKWRLNSKNYSWQQNFAVGESTFQRKCLVTSSAGVLRTNWSKTGHQPVFRTLGFAITVQTQIGSTDSGGRKKTCFFLALHLLLYGQTHLKLPALAYVLVEMGLFYHSFP